MTAHRAAARVAHRATSALGSVLATVMTMVAIIPAIRHAAFRAETIPAREMLAGAILAGAIVARTILAGTIAARAILARTIAARAIMAATIAARAILAGAIVAGTIVAGTVLGVATTAQAQPGGEPMDPEAVLGSLDWQLGPGVADIGGVASIRLPGGFMALGPNDTRRFLEILGNPLSEEQKAIVMPQDSMAAWFMLFSFDPCGYVRDDAKNRLDPDAILETLQQRGAAFHGGPEEAGRTAMRPVGWQIEPRYDEIARLLEWCLILESREGRTLNHNIRLLGRNGVMEAVLVCGPEELEATLPLARLLLRDLQYRAGHRYVEWKSGDMVAPIGLVALITGEAVEPASRTGLGSNVLKVLLVVLVVVAALLARFYPRLSGGRRSAS